MRNIGWYYLVSLKLYYYLLYNNSNMIKKKFVDNDLKIEKCYKISF